MFKISFCTVSMNRLQHIRETLPANLADNRDYANLEFVLYDYNSKDGLARWVEKNCKEALASGKLIFKRTDQPRYFDWSRSKNQAFHLASGDIVCGIDADNFTGPGFAKFINRHFQENPDSFLSMNYKDQFNNISDTFGRVACYKKDFLAIGGYDESMKGYSYEDIDFCNRLTLLGRKQHFITDKRFHKVIKHTDLDRIGSTAHFSSIHTVYISYLSPFESKVFFLFKDGGCSFGTLQDSNEGFGNPTIKEKRWITGEYHFDETGSLEIDLQGSHIKLLPKDEHLINERGEIFYEIKDGCFLEALQRHYSVIGNHQVLVNNMKEKKIKVNQ
ncbi:glycosyltransferase [Fulvivirgaceae bacterium BMA12]|uniref:Glycosyltransferase n=1 Tax=Agaribacillus aureus TaxID=3051825 RepID=A0ABT8KYJ9_9BACT|nr:glycosyltransferase [Fulvivirgaceae bacterium BMA12]